ncbi:Uncharacterized membrane protein YgdD, TMEM256/DUF423 family [Thalassospira xiamenensis M-5 = DSM 17429]|uniref:DUF423 domain-containing protein n=1 Tax=Thalassospira xiamenensis M-5 = DSM 17429 TaxID=1123366 RepID=A0AB72UCM9_9PROT|nr:DUF423 domain-containing protein [Thalassospira xiamenensis]AJD51899.1 hypothetical protein TH3_08905 [Thalassospira xiamenensis M-5 = DSM 17429]SIS98527.1 Uncharacterized membrane protein YgdD, TMEM256/DUF423 family [Thalassospira xiamenensis M-5 = DSM 17429]
MRLSVVFAGLNGAIAVALGAFATHSMAGEEMSHARDLVETAAHYQLVHAAGVAAIAALAHQVPDERLLRWAAYAMLAGILFFCGALYVIAFAGISAFGMVAPIGGLAFITGWLMLAGAGWKRFSA